jgi:hypothetical protein
MPRGHARLDEQQRVAGPHSELDRARHGVHVAAFLDGLAVGFGRIVVLEIGVPNLLKIWYKVDER